MAEVIRYVDPDAVGSGSGVDWTNAYTSLSAWETAEQQDLVSAGDWMHVYCRSSSGTADSSVSIDDFTTDATHYILIEAADGDQALKTGFDISRYRLDGAGSEIVINDLYVRIKGIQIRNTLSGGNCITSSQVGLRFEDLYLVAPANGNGINLSGGSSTAVIENCIAYCPTGPDANNEGYIFNSSAVSIYNSISYGFGDGIERDFGTIDVVNCAIFNNTDDFDGTMTINYCASDDGDGTNSQAPSGGDWDNEFTSPATGDFTAVETGNIQNGVGPSADANVPALDIEGDTRSGATAFIGVDEPAAGGDVVITADSGTYSITGTAADILADRFIDADSGTYSLVGTDVDFIIISDAFIAAENGTYSLTGTAAAILADRVMTADSGTFSLVGTDVEFIIISEAVIEADSGVFNWLGFSAILTKGDNQVPEYGGLMGVDILDELRRFEFNHIDLGIAIGEGELNGVAQIEKYGKNVTAEAGDVVQDEEGAIAIETGASTIELISTSTDDDDGGAGAQAVNVVGVDADWNPIQEEMRMNGTSATLSSSKSFLYVYRAKIIDSGAVRNQGIITIRKSAAGSTLAMILATKGQTQKAMFPVPAGCTVYIKKFRLEGSKTGSLVGAVNLMSYELDEGIRVSHSLVFSSGEPMTVEWDVGVKKFTEKTLVWVEVESISVGAELTASFDGVIVRHSDSTPA